MCLYDDEELLQALGYPPALIKAVHDPFDYAILLRSGELIRFNEAVAHGAWVRLLMGLVEGDGVTPSPKQFTFERGIDVRVADIVWATDAPTGT